MTMMHDTNGLYRLLDEAGIAAIQHSHDDLRSHLIGTFEELVRLGCPDHVALAGLFHSVYGTEGFPRQSIGLSRRVQLRSLIGPGAELLVYQYCTMSYDSLRRSVDAGKPLLEDRFTRKPIPMSMPAFAELLWIKLADAVEQADERTPQSRFLKKVATLVGPDAEAYWDRIERTGRTSALYSFRQH